MTPQPSPPVSHPHTGVHRQEDDHAEIERILDQIADAAETDITGAAFGELWSNFTELVETHFRMEEQVLFIRADARYGANLRRLWRDHVELRERVEQMTAEVDRRELRTETVRSFVRALRAHGEIEDRSAYMWAPWDLPNT